MITSYNNKNTLKLVKTFDIVQQLLSHKNILQSEIIAYKFSKTLYLNSVIYFKSNKIKRFNRYRKVLKPNRGAHKDQLYSFLQEFFRSNSFYLKIHNLNKFINKSYVTNLNLSLKQFKRIIFNKRENLYIDFLNCSSLLIQERFSAKSYLELLCEIFRFLHKKKHKFFFRMLNLVLKQAMIINKNIKGTKIDISGRIKGAQRASFFKIKLGSSPVKDYLNRLESSQSTSFTYYGTYGFKIWISYNYDTKKI